MCSFSSCAASCAASVLGQGRASTYLVEREIEAYGDAADILVDPTQQRSQNSGKTVHHCSIGCLRTVVSVLLSTRFWRLLDGVEVKKKESKMYATSMCSRVHMAKISQMLTLTRDLLRCSSLPLLSRWLSSLFALWSHAGAHGNH